MTDDFELPPSKATFSDLAKRMAEDQPSNCAAHAESITTELDDAAKVHLASCAKCRDLRDQIVLLIRHLEKLPRPESKARFKDLRPRLKRRPWGRVAAIAAAGLIAIGVTWQLSRPSTQVITRTPIQRYLDEKFTTEQFARAIYTEADERAIVAIGFLNTPAGEAHLEMALGVRRSLDPHIARTLAARGAGLPKILGLVLRGRTDLLPALTEAPPGAVEGAINLYSINATPQEAAALVGLPLPGARRHAVEAAAMSHAHRDACFGRAVQSDLVFLVAAAGDISLREAAEELIEKQPPAKIVEACRAALRDPELVLGAARVAERCKLSDLAPDLLAAYFQGPPSGDAAAVEIRTWTPIDDYDSAATAACVAALRVCDATKICAAVRTHLASNRPRLEDFRRVEDFQRLASLRMKSLALVFNEYKTIAGFEEEAKRALELIK